MSKGFVYILSNPCMPGIVKIGKTTRDVVARAGELFQTGVPTKFVVEHSVATPDCSQLEAQVHSFLPDLRVSDQREFFRMEVSDAIQLLDTALFEQINAFVSEFIPSHSLARLETILAEECIAALSTELDVHPFNVSVIMEYVSADELRPAKELWESASIRRRDEMLAREAVQ